MTIPSNSTLEQRITAKLAKLRVKGVTGNKNNKLYYMGHLVAAEDYKYQPVVMDVDRDGNDDAMFIVNPERFYQHSALEYKEDGTS